MSCFCNVSASDDLDKGLQFLESGFEAHSVKTPRKAYDYLDRAYKNAGKPVPFERPWWKEKEKYQVLRKISGIVIYLMYLYNRNLSCCNGQHFLLLEAS